jgi:hypothetical protein
MNPRIEQIAEKCGFRSNPDILDRNQSFDIPKFAEMIIQDCLSQLALIGLANIENDDISWTAEHSIKSIKEHFGMPE